MSRLTIIVKGPYDLAQGDEVAFFNWLRTIKCIEDVGGAGSDLHITLARPPGHADLRELRALFFRYRMDMKCLAVFRTSRNAGWFAENPKAYWRLKVFGKAEGHCF